MKLLVLGGGRFVGRHLVDAALARGFDVTTFSRGRQPDHWNGRVHALVGDRDPTVAPGLEALRTGHWDALIDTCGYVPRVVRAAAELLSGRVGRYLFVSSISVYLNPSGAGLDESAPVGALDDPATEEVGKFYGPLKAACERVVEETFGARATVVRPGLIVGPHDSTDRFGYWAARFLHPKLLGDRGDAAVVPAPPERPLQFIDARDLGAFMLDLLAQGTGGTFHATSPAGQWTFGSLVDTLREVGGAKAPRTVWTDEARLLACKVEPWTGLPLWIPQTFTDATGMMQFDTRRAQRAGLTMRPLVDIVRDTGAWLAQRDNAGAWKAVLSADVEREVLAAAA
jgi:2'-hydroxyisoflavone reductase